MTELILVIGPCGSGKTTHARTHYPKHLHPDYEALIRSLFASQDAFRFYPQVRATGAKLYRLAARELIMRHIDVCIPDTGTTRQKREEWFSMARDAGADIHVIRLLVECETAIKRAQSDVLRPKTARPHWREIIEHWFRDFEPVDCEQEGITTYTEIDNNG